MTIEYKDSKRISALSSDLEGLKAYWKMNDSSGKLLNTASSQGNTALSGSDLTVSGTTGYGVTGHVSGVNAYSFTNADGNKAVADNSASDWNFLTNSGNKFTITLWLKLDSNNVNADFIGTGNSGSNDFAIRYRGAVSDKKFAIFFSNEGEKITSTSTTLTDTNWHFYMIQYDDSVGTLRFQKDNLTVEEFTGLNLTSTGNPTTALSFGDSNTSTSETGGDMQEVTVWDRYLTTAEIAQIYNSGSGAELQNTTIPFGGRPTDVQDNSILVEKDTARRYWFDGTTWTRKLPVTSGLKLHLDASESSTITKDSSNLVSQWNDFSSQGNNISQATSSKQPLFVENVQNGRPVIRFDGSNDMLQRTTYVNGALTQPNTVFYVGKIGGNEDFTFASGTLGSENSVLTTGSNLTMYAGSIYGADNAVTTLQQYTFLYNTTSSTMRVNGSQTDTGSVGTHTMQGFTVGANYTDAQWSAIDVCEILVYNGTLSDTNRDEIESYLMEKWGLS